MNGKLVHTHTKKAITIRVTEFHADQPIPEEVEIADQETLQHYRDVVEVVHDGMAVDPTILKQVEFLISGDRLVLQGPGRTFGRQHYEFQLDASNSPKRIDLFPLVRGIPQGAPIQGVYDLSSGDLIICLPDPDATERPAKLESAVNSKQRLFRFKRS